jgi:hypothetical protein
MNKHLSAKQISMCIAGNGSREELEHSRACPKCAAEMDRFESAVLGLRQGLSGCAEQHLKPGAWAYLKPATVNSRRLAGVLAGAVAAAALSILAVAPIYRSFVEPRYEVSVTAEAEQDTELLEQVDLQLSRSVPATLEPLMDLLALNEESQDDSNGGRQ